MAMGTRKQREKQEDLWIAHTELASAPGHPFYQKLNELLEAERFDEFVEGRCAKFYAVKYGRPSLTPGIYFRSLLIGYFEGIEAERGIAWRLADSLALRRFVGIALDEYTPDHSTISRTRRLIDLDTHREVFGWVLGVLADRGLLKGQRIAIDATTLEANAAMRSIVQARHRARATMSFCEHWRRPRASRRRPAKTWCDWTASARSARRTRTGRARRTGMRGLRR
jgi:transposase